MNTPDQSKITPIKPIPAPVRRDLKTPEPQRKHARNFYRRKKGIPVEAPLGTRAEPFNKRRRGSGNLEAKVSMPPKVWEELDDLKLSIGNGIAGVYTRGEVIAILIRQHTKTKRP